MNYVSRRCTHAFTPRRGACTRHSSSPDSHTDGQPSEERRVIHVRGTGCCPSLPLSPVKIHGQFSLISNDVSKREEGREGGTRDPRSVASKVAYFVPSYLYRPSLSFSPRFLSRSPLSVERESSFYPMRVYCIRTKVYTFSYIVEGEARSSTVSLSLVFFLVFSLSFSHTRTLYLSISLHQTTRCTRISRISLIVYLRIVRYARRRTKYLMPDFFFLFLVPAYGGSTFCYRVNIFALLSLSLAELQTRQTIDQDFLRINRAKVKKRKKRETPSPRKKKKERKKKGKDKEDGRGGK